MPFGTLPPINQLKPAGTDPLLDYFRSLVSGNQAEEASAESQIPLAQKAYEDFINQATAPGSLMAQRTAAAQQAGEQYQRAAGTPMPAISPLDRMPIFFSQIGDILGQTKTLEPAAQEQFTQQREELLKSRQENLAQMRDIWEKKIAAASQLPPQVELEARQKLEQINKAIQQVHDLRVEHAAETRAMATVGAGALRGGATMSAADIRAQEDLQKSVDQIRAKLFGEAPGGGPGGGGPNNPAPATPGTLPTPPVTMGDSLREDIMHDHYISGQQLLTQEAKAAATIYAGNNHVPILNAKQEDSLGEVNVAKANIGLLRNLTMQLLPADWQSRPAAIAGIKFGKLLQSKPLAAAWGALRETGLQQLRGTAGVTGNRQADRQFQLIQKNDLPQQIDDIPTAFARTEIVDNLLGARHDWIMGNLTAAKSKYAAAYEASLKLPQSSALARATQMEAMGVGAAPGMTGVHLIDDKGKDRYLSDPKEIQEAVSQHGWKRAPVGK